jgi:PAS domain S-box-containing protein
MPALLKLRDTFKSNFDRPAPRWGIASIAAAILIGTAVYNYHQIDRELTSVALSRRAAVAQLISNTLSEKFGRSIDVGVSLSTRVQFRKLVAAKKWAEASEILRGVPSDFPYIDRMFLVDPQGTLQADVPSLPGVRGNNFEYRDWYQGVSRNWRPYISGIYSREAAPQLQVFTVALPIKSAGGQVVGILGLQIRIESLLQWLEAIKLDLSALIYLVDPKDQMVFHSRQGDQKKIISMAAPQLIKKMLSQKDDVEIGFDEVQQQESIISLASLPDYGWSVVVIQPASSSIVLKSRDRQLRMLLAGYGFILLLGVITAILLLRIVSARQRAESDAHFVTIVNTATDAIISVDQDQRIVLFNHGAEIIFGYSAAEMLGQPLDRLLPKQLGEIHRSHIQNFASAPEVSRASRHMAKGREISGRRKDGTEFPVEASIAKSTVNGQLTLTAILRDVSERKHAEDALRASESRYRTLFDTLIEGFCTIEMIFDDNGKAMDYRFIEINPAFEKQTGLHNAQGKLMRDLAPDHEAHWFEIYGKIALTGEPAQFENEAKALGRHYSVCAYRIGGPESRRVAILFNDITERKQAEMRIKQLNADLEHRVIERTSELAAVNKELEAFSYSVSHDLRAPLRSIDGFSQALLEDYAGGLDDQARDYLNRVRGATQRMGLLIDDMLTLSRVTRAGMRRGTVDLSALAADVLEELRKSEPERKVDWHIEPGLIVSGDAQLLRVVLDNLLSNAWKFTGNAANARIEFGAMHNDGTMEFFVRDNGAGFDMTYADKLFGAFQRLHTANEFPGTGIGLATVQRIISRHGGQVRAEGVPGQGATFFFTLPD